jgi:two-component system CheB/CheR fusion protein
VLIDDEHDIVHLSPSAAQLLQHAAGEPTRNLLRLVPSALRIELRTALHRAMQGGELVETPKVQVAAGGEARALSMRVVPIKDGSYDMTLVLFDVEAPGAAPAPPLQARAHPPLVAQLDQELERMRMHLRDTVEQYENSTQELKASNEELQAINEELRSATEELETSKEELQSMNEELVTVNFELKMKVEERGRIHDDMQNLIASSEIATVFVDRGMHVKRYTPHASNLFNLIATDLGRSLFDITSRLDYPQLAEDTAAAFKELRTIERHVTSVDGRHYLARILPYRTAEDKIEGAILNFFDITDLTAAEERVRAGEERLRLVAATTRDFAIITTDDHGLIATWNVGARRIFGYTEEEMLRKPLATIFTAEDQANGVPEKEMRRAREIGRSEDERWHQRKDGSRFFCSGVTTRLEAAAGGGYAKIARDMTGTKQHELAQEHRLFKEKKASLSAQMANELKDKFLAVMSHELKQPLNLIQMNAELLMHTPATADNPVARRVGETIRRAVASQTAWLSTWASWCRLRRTALWAARPARSSSWRRTAKPA